MEFSVIAAMLASTVGGGIVASVCGFGFGAVAMSVWPYFLPYAQSVAVSALCGACTALMIAVPFRKSINFKTLLPCVIFGPTAAAVAAQLAVGAADTLMVPALGVMLVAVSVYSLFFGGKITIRPTFLNGAIAGLIGGTCAGLTSVGGPPVAIYMLSSARDNQEYRATLNAYFCFTTIISSCVRAANGIITLPIVKLWLMVVAALALGLWLGNKIFNRLNAVMLRRVVYTYLLFSGLTMIFK